MSKPAQAQRDAILNYLDAHFIDAVRALQRLVRIPSVKEAPQQGMPFGAPMRDCLDAALALGRRLGFTTTDLDGYVGLCDAGAGPETLAILCHLDVVPAGAGWTFPPFGAEVAQGRLYGRGAIDDKGPAICALYALAAVRAAGVPLRRRVRILLGCDEESGWACIARYKQSEPAPTLAFSPDGSYPLVYAERTICQATFHGDCRTRLRIRAGERANVVPGEATAWVPFAVEHCPAPQGVAVRCTPEEGGTRITLEGRATHASTPEEGCSALLGLLRVLDGLPIAQEDGAGVIHTLHAALNAGFHGEGFGLDFADESGRLTLSPGILNWDADGLTLCLDLRIPLGLTAEAAKARLCETLAPAGLSLQASHGQPGHCIPLESELVQTLLDVYRVEGGDPALAPLAIGGGTYARAFPNAVAFGCERQDGPMLAHMPDEYIPLEELRFHMRVIAFAITALAGA